MRNKTKGRVDDSGRECTKCREYRLWVEYSKGPGPNGKQCVCKPCSAAEALKRFYANHERCLKTQAEYRALHREELNAKSTQWKKDHPEAHRKHVADDYRRHTEARLAQRKAWTLKNPEIANKCHKDKKARRPEHYRAIQRAAVKRWTLKFPEKVADYEQRRRSAKLQATPIWANRSEILSIFRLARILRDVTGCRYHVDHIVPLQHPLVCGLHVTANLRVIGAFDNGCKYNSFDQDSFDPDDVPNVQWAHRYDARLIDKVEALIVRVSSFKVRDQS